MIQRLRVGVFGEGVPISPAYDLVPYVCIYNLEPFACSIMPMPCYLSVPQLFEAFSRFTKTTARRAHEEVEGVEGIRVGFALALDQLIEF